MTSKMVMRCEKAVENALRLSIQLKNFKIPDILTQYLLFQSIDIHQVKQVESVIT